MLGFMNYDGVGEWVGWFGFSIFLCFRISPSGELGRSRSRLTDLCVLEVDNLRYQISAAAGRVAPESDFSTDLVVFSFAVAGSMMEATVSLR